MKTLYRGTTSHYVRGNIILPHPTRLKAPDGRDMLNWGIKIHPRFYLISRLGAAEMYAAWEALATGGEPVVAVFEVTPDMARYIRVHHEEGEDEYLVEVDSWNSPLPFPATRIVPIRKSKLQEAYNGST